MIRELQDLTSEVNAHLTSTETDATTGFKISTFKFEFPVWLSKRPDRKLHLDVTSRSETDEDGDPVINRHPETVEGQIQLEHAITTSLEQVGTQLWRGSLYLADFLLASPQILGKSQQRSVLEIGAGTGLLGIVADCHPSISRITLTDLPQIVPLIRRNLARNHSNGNPIVEELVLGSSLTSIEHLHFDLVLCADIIYDNALTLGIIDLVKELGFKASAEIDFLFSFEKRFNFTLEDMNVTAPAYDFFMDKLKSISAQNFGVEWTLITEDFPQYFCYERTLDLYLLHLVIKPKQNI